MIGSRAVFFIEAVSEAVSGSIGNRRHPVQIVVGVYDAVAGRIGQRLQARLAIPRRRHRIPQRIGGRGGAIVRIEGEGGASQPARP